MARVLPKEHHIRTAQTGGCDKRIKKREDEAKEQAMVDTLHRVQSDAECWPIVADI